MSSRIVNAKDVTGAEVRNPQDENLGKIEALMIDKVSGEVSQVVLSFGGFLGMGNKLFALPWSILHFDADKDCFIISVDKEKLKNAPGFDKDAWPDMVNTNWSTQIHQYYGVNVVH